MFIRSVIFTALLLASSLARAEETPRLRAGDPPYLCLATATEKDGAVHMHLSLSMIHPYTVTRQVSHPVRIPAKAGEKEKYEVKWEKKKDTWHISVMKEADLVVDGKEVKVSRKSGQPVDPRDLPRLLGKETPVLVFADGKVGPDHLRAVQDDVLIVVPANKIFPRLFNTPWKKDGAPEDWLTAVFWPCFPVTEPLSDPCKARPDRRLLGKWQDHDETCRMEIAASVVKSHPQGLLRALVHQAGDPRKAASAWFFTTRIGKQTYATVFIDPGVKYADFSKEGSFEKWNRRESREYLIFRVVLEGDKLTFNICDSRELDKLMDAEKIEGMPYKTPPRWLATYLKKHGPQPLFNQCWPDFRRVKE